MNVNPIISRIALIVLAVFLVFTSACSLGEDDDEEPESVERFQGIWEGTYEGAVEQGTWTAVIDNKGNIKGTVFSTTLSVTFELSGLVTSDGDFNATAGSTTTGSRFQGSLDANSGLGQGTWENEASGQSGNWTGQKMLAIPS